MFGWLRKLAPTPEQLADKIAKAEEADKCSVEARLHRLKDGEAKIKMAHQEQLNCMLPFSPDNMACSKCTSTRYSWRYVPRSGGVVEYCGPLYPPNYTDINYGNPAHMVCTCVCGNSWQTKTADQQETKW